MRAYWAVAIEKSVVVWKITEKNIRIDSVGFSAFVTSFFREVTLSHFDYTREQQQSAAPGNAALLLVFRGRKVPQIDRTKLLLKNRTTQEKNKASHSQWPPQHQNQHSLCRTISLFVVHAVPNTKWTPQPIRSPAKYATTLANMSHLSGQIFTTAKDLRSKHENKIEPCGFDSNVFEIWTEPKFGIGQRACLIRTPNGNVLWDLVALLDQSTVDRIAELGGVQCIVISHPHFYTTWADWGADFQVSCLHEQDRLCLG